MDDIIFEVAKLVAESDSIGEGYSYCRNYTREMFDNPDGECEEEYKELAKQIVSTVLYLKHHKDLGNLYSG